jgi:hypothetical protein
MLDLSPSASPEEKSRAKQAMLDADLAAGLPPMQEQCEAPKAPSKRRRSKLLSNLPAKPEPEPEEEDEEEIETAPGADDSEAL